MDNGRTLLRRDTETHDLDKERVLILCQLFIRSALTFGPMYRTNTVTQWATALTNPTLSVLPFDFVRPAEGSVVEAQLTEALSSKTVAELDQIAKNSGVAGATDFSAALALYAILVYRLSGDEDVCLGSDDAEGNVFVFRSNLNGTSTSLGDLIKSVVEFETWQKDSGVKFADILAEIQTSQKLESEPVLFRTSFQHLQSDTESQSVLGPAAGRLTDVSVYLGKESLSIHYNSLLYKEDRMKLFASQIVELIAQAAVLGPSAEVGKLSLLSPQQRDGSLLPLPTSDLDWSGFRGPIHEIFAENAKNHPDRPCCVETASALCPESKERSFTYKQIDEASNVLAHHLVASGIKPGHVVMIYAYRGVDLVVSVMGTLKAGATFSVIDPAYPPARQTIYLRVAQPRALVVIGKAGKIDQLVTDYCDKELQLLTLVPELALTDDGALVGGEVEGSDILASSQAKKGEQTGVLVGPDSNPTLSFTSGSEGIPKGVLGRHYSLTYYFPWMAETFGLSDKDKFTMLSGIAHDPIQRDIFTPLFLGAQLIIPTSDDIGTPGRLAEWMATYETTVTHLTPAMGQLLSAQATAQIPSLHHAFFVGDILTKRDCTRLQKLAQNVFIVNMYGTTETQRSVSYFQVASYASDSSFLAQQKDIMPAGKGMKNVQLLVVNQHDRTQTCGVGEVGEIYVRAAGLAEGYLLNDALNAEKFVTNWFVTPEHWIQEDEKVNKGEAWREFYKGPRDRLYRTGDLGRYLPDGNVECSGRADDQVKIRGFRIELGEIDTHLSRHPLVRENVTLVRRDKDEEPVLTSYIVVQNTDAVNEFLDAQEDEEETDQVVQGLFKYRKLIKNIKEFLKTKLPSYAIPTVVVPLAKMPLNPNGKVDKPALPFPDTAQLAIVAQKAAAASGDANAAPIEFTETQAAIRDIWLDVLPQQPATISPDDSFFDLGGHSILATRMIFELRKKLMVEIPLGLIFKSPSIAGFALEVDKLKKGGEVEFHGENESDEQEQAAVDYYNDAKTLIADAKLVASSYPSHSGKLDASAPVKVFLTGGTGFLGSFLLRDLLERSQNIHVFAHVRAKTVEAGLDRLRNSSEAYGIWKDEWASRITPIIGDLEKADFGLSKEQFSQLTDEVDVIIHNGALVHWVYPYSTLRGPNVLGSINVMNLALTGKAKIFNFVSSTSAVDTEHFNKLSADLVEEGKAGVPESDDLMGSSVGLGNGYGQSKWVAEHVIREAGARGLTGTIIRPGYVVGDSKTGATNTDDFLVRMIKGCIQLGEIPNIHNSVNMVPVDHVARVVTAASFWPKQPSGVVVAHVTSQPRTRFNEFLQTLQKYGYKVSVEDYVTWRLALEKFVVEDSQDSALYPLLHFVLDDLPQSTKAPELDDSNARSALSRDAEWTGVDLSAGKGVDEAQMGIYLAYLVAVGFLDAPQSKGELALPKVELSEQTLDKLKSVGGRGGNK